MINAINDRDNFFRDRRCVLGQFGLDLLVWCSSGRPRALTVCSGSCGRRAASEYVNVSDAALPMPWDLSRFSKPIDGFVGIRSICLARALAIC